MSLTSTDLTAALTRIAQGVIAHREELCAADGALGDGDLGITVAEGFAATAAVDLPEDLGQAFFALSKAFQAASSSSFGTLIATGFMAAAKELKGKTEFEEADLARLLGLARDAMLARGKSELGQKTVLDGIDAQVKALEAGGGKDAAIAAAEATLAHYTPLENKTGRARIFAEKSAGLPDPGQLALLRITQSL